MQKLVDRILRNVELSAYALALWSFLVLFLEPVIGFYFDYRSVEFYTAAANVGLLLLTIINRGMSDSERKNRRLLALDTMLMILGGLLLIYNAKFVIFFLLIRQTYFILQFMIFRAFEGKFYKLLTNNPPVTLMLSFALMIGIGTLLLMLPAASVNKQVTPLIDALFTATSATCVTGLAIKDTGTYFSFFGQIVILILIQLGGLGIMTISTAFAIILGQRITLKLESVMVKMVGGSNTINVLQLLKNIVLVTILIEGIGAAILYTRFAVHFPPMRAFYMSVFHSISAFCNAGFSLLDTSMMGFVDDVVMNIGLSMLIIFGGLGFTVLIDLHRYVFVKEKVKKLSLHTKIVLFTTLGLLLAGFLAFMIGEWNSSMSGFGLSRRILASWFQSVTTRTAGFNTIDMSVLSRASILFTVILMFIGASPGSTGGGIKTTTFAVLVMSVTAVLKGKRDLSIYNRKIPQSNFKEATSLIILAGAILFFIMFLLMLSEPLAFEKLMFEATSAFGTVGLSMGITSQLTEVGKFLITLLMYIGRIGPLTMIYALAIRKHPINIDYAEEKIAIG